MEFRSDSEYIKDPVVLQTPACALHTPGQVHYSCVADVTQDLRWSSALSPESSVQPSRPIDTVY